MTDGHRFFTVRKILDEFRNTYIYIFSAFQFFMIWSDDSMTNIAPWRHDVSVWTNRFSVLVPGRRPELASIGTGTHSELVPARKASLEAW